MRLLSIVLFASLLSIQSTCSQENSISQDQKSLPDVVKIQDYENGIDHEGLATAVFAGGCFWCTEAAFHRINGVIDVISGYAGGEDVQPNYKWVCSGKTPFAEAIFIYYDPAIIEYSTLLDVLFVAHNPTQKNRQGNDIGPQYRSAIFYQNDEQKKLAEEKIEYLNPKYEGKIVTTLEAYDQFWTAEAYHQDFYEHNPNQSYVSAVSRPKVLKVMSKFPTLLKKEYKAK